MRDWEEGGDEQRSFPLSVCRKNALAWSREQPLAFLGPGLIEGERMRFSVRRRSQEEGKKAAKDMIKK